MVNKTALRRSVPVGELPDFDTVPRKSPRHDGWTPERQRAFIPALADTGCAAIAARMVNMSAESAYQLRRAPGAESFRRAWDAAQSLGLQRVKDEAFDRAMNGELVPVFVAGKLMGFRRKKNDRLLMFILRHYGQDSNGRKTTINYFSTRATAGAGAAAQADPAADPSAAALARAEVSTATVKTLVSGPHQSTTLMGGVSGGNAPNRIAEDDRAAAIVNAFEGVDLDAEAQAEIYRTLESCAERRRALENDPENDPERYFIGERETTGYLGELESGVEGDRVEYKPDGEHRWENLGEGGGAAEIDKVLAGIEERRAAMTPEQLAAEQAEHEAGIKRIREQLQARALPKAEPDPDDPRLDWRNWTDGGYKPPSDPPRHECRVELPPAIQVRSGGLDEATLGDQPKPLAKDGGGAAAPAAEVPSKEPVPDDDRGSKRSRKRSPEPGRRAYKKRRPKPPFTPPGEARKAQAIAEVEAARREGAAAEAVRRRARARRDQSPG